MGARPQALASGSRCARPMRHNWALVMPNSRRHRKLATLKQALAQSSALIATFLSQASPPTQAREPIPLEIAGIAARPLWRSTDGIEPMPVGEPFSRCSEPVRAVWLRPLGFSQSELDAIEREIGKLDCYRGHRTLSITSYMIYLVDWAAGEPNLIESLRVLAAQLGLATRIHKTPTGEFILSKTEAGRSR